jgi:hypothetical protein
MFSCIRKTHQAEKDGGQKVENIHRKETENSTSDLSYQGTGRLKKLYDTYHASSPQSLYDSLVNKLLMEEDGGIRQMYYNVHDFYGYISDLKWRFCLACGDSKGSDIPEGNEERVNLTNSFFLNTAPATYLLNQLLETKKSLSMNTLSDTIRKEINAIGQLLGEYRSSYTGEYWQKMYFHDKTPRDAISVLNRFEHQVKNIEFAILIEHFNK